MSRPVGAAVLLQLLVEGVEVGELDVGADAERERLKHGFTQILILTACGHTHISATV